MTQEIRENGKRFALLKIEKFYSSDGRQTCGTDFQGGRHCPLFRFSDFGQRYICAYDGLQIHTDNPSGSGYTRPTSSCPLTKEQA